MASAQNAVLVSGVLLCLVAASTYALPMRVHSVFSAPQGLSVLGSENAESSVDGAAAARERRGLLDGLPALGSGTQSVGSNPTDLASGVGSSLGSGLASGLLGGTQKQQSQGVSSQDATNNANIDGVTNKVQSIKEGLSNTEKIQNPAPLSLPKAPLSTPDLSAVSAANPTNLADTQGISNIAGGTPGLSSVDTANIANPSLTKNMPLQAGVPEAVAQANSVLLKPATVSDDTPTRPSAIETFEVNSDADAEGDETASEESDESPEESEDTPSNEEAEASTEDVE